MHRRRLQRYARQKLGGPTRLTQRAINSTLSKNLQWVGQVVHNRLATDIKEAKRLSQKVDKVIRNKNFPAPEIIDVLASNFGPVGTLAKGAIKYVKRRWWDDVKKKKYHTKLYYDDMYIQKRRKHRTYRRYGHKYYNYPYGKNYYDDYYDDYYRGTKGFNRFHYDPPRSPPRKPNPRGDPWKPPVRYRPSPRYRGPKKKGKRGKTPFFDWVKGAASKIANEAKKEWRYKMKDPFYPWILPKLEPVIPRQHEHQDRRKDAGKQYGPLKMQALMTTHGI